MSVSLHPLAYSPLLPSSRISVARAKPTHDTDRSNLKKRLRQRTMQYGDQSENDVLNTSQAGRATSGSHLAGVESVKRTTSPSSPPRRLSQDSSGRRSRSPVTPEVNPPSKSTKKRTASQIDQVDRDQESTNSTFSENRRDSEDSVLHVCLCQPDPKIPRPRNAFILYRQHHQAAVVAQNPGLANPEISKIIGEQWQNQTVEVKNKWKALAEEEKIRHQQQHPTYRYQPKRSGRRNSLNSDGSSIGSRPVCPKCGGYTNLPPFQTSPDKITSAPGSATGPSTPGSVITPVTRTLPTLRELSLQSPPTRPEEQMAGGHISVDDREVIGSLSPGSKRRRFNDAPLLTRVMPSRYAVAQPPVGAPIGPGTPYPFAQQAPHPYPLAISHERRDSLPSIRGVMAPPAAMAPPPRPGMGYQQHRLSQGHPSHDRSLTLPPLQSGKSEAAPSSKSTEKDVHEQIMSMDFRYKIRILNQVAPPEPVSGSTLRGPLIAIEGDSEECAQQVSAWLHEELGKGNDRRVNLLDSPSVSTSGSKKMIMAAYHRLIADWLEKSSEIYDSLIAKVVSPNNINDTVMIDAGAAVPTRRGSAVESIETAEQRDTPPDCRRPGQSNGPADQHGAAAAVGVAPSSTRSVSSSSSSSEAPIVARNNNYSNSNIDNDPNPPMISATAFEALKPIGLIANYSLHASNHFACNIPVTAPDPYSPSDHWQWTATQWRGVISPDLTIYVRDVAPGDAAASAAAKPTVEFMEEGGSLCVLRRTKREGSKVEAPSLRRLGFEVSEWVRAFGSKGL